MSVIEDSVRPSIEPMMDGRRVGLSTEAQTRIATWLTLKLYTFDQMTLSFPNYAALVSYEEMREFREKPAPPPEYYVRLGFLSGFENHTVTFENVPTITDPNYRSRPPGATPARTELRLSLGCILFECFFANKATPKKELPLLDLEPQSFYTAIWPTTTSKDWPPPHSIKFSGLPLIQADHWWQ
jgi:hypothetical protein